MTKPVFAVLASLTAACIATQASAENRVTLFANATYGIEAVEYTGTSTFTYYLEEGSFSADHSAESAVGGEVGIQFDFTRHLGVRASYAIAERDLGASYIALLPNPLYLAETAERATGSAFREVEGDVSGLSYKESVGRFDLVVGGGSGSVRYSLFAGVAVFSVEADLVDGAEYADSYPFDTVTVQSTSTSTLKDSPLGFDAGASLDFMFTENLGVGATFRYSRAKAELAPPEADTVAIDTGGPEAAVGIRIGF